MNKVLYASIVCAVCAIGAALLHISRTYAILLCVSVCPLFNPFLFCHVFTPMTLQLCGFVATLYAIPRCMDKFVRAGIVGKDINKINRAAPNYAELKAKAPDVPESQGLVVGAVYLCCVMLCQPLLRDFVCFLSTHLLYESFSRL